MGDDINDTLIERATRAFGDEDQALRWLTRDQHRFQGATPLDYATGERGMATVLEHLARIEHGIYPGARTLGPRVG